MEIQHFHYCILNGVFGLDKLFFTGPFVLFFMQVLSQSITSSYDDKPGALKDASLSDIISGAV